MTDLRVHDLLQIPSPDAVTVVDPPFWLAGALEAAPWVVVRRAPPRGGKTAVGIRGTTRDQRCAAYLDPAVVLRKVAPEDIVARRAWLTAPWGGEPVLAELAARAAGFTTTDLTWGVAGGAGFELVTGAPVLTGSSDLDLVVRCAFPLPIATLRAFAARAGEAPCRIDVLVETSSGGFSLAEFAGKAEPLLLRRPDGPRLVERASLPVDAAP